MKLAQITAKYIGKTFDDYGCIELVDAVLRDLGRPLPDDIDNITVGNYRELLEYGVRRAQYEMLCAFRQIGKPASTKYPAIGSLLVVMQPGVRLFPAVALGGGMALASFIRAGVCVFNLDRYNRPIMAREVV